MLILINYHVLINYHKRKPSTHQKEVVFVQCDFFSKLAEFIEFIQKLEKYYTLFKSKLKRSFLKNCQGKHPTT